MKTKTKSIIAALTLFLMLPFTITPASANSAQQHWSGSDATGAIIVDGDSPIIVEHENLTFELAELPSNYYGSEEEFFGYAGKVSAEYTFYNPSDMTVTATLAFPFGIMPDYGYEYNDSSITGRAVKVNGEDIEADVRYTLASGGQFSLAEDLPRLSDEYLENDMFSPETTVTLYKWRINKNETGGYPSAANVATDIKSGYDGRFYYFAGQSGAHRQDDGDFRICDWVDGKEYIELYVIGKPLDSLPTWTFYRDGGAEDGEEISGSVSFIGENSITLLDLALNNYDESRAISEIDWYNAFYAELTSQSFFKYNDHPIVSLYSYERLYSRDLMRWYQYDITLSPGQRLTNTVTAPMYSSIDLSYTPAIYEYTYLLSPASTWKSFGTLDIAINTPYYLTESSLDGFTKTERGYTLSIDTLPEGELMFTLSTEETPEKDSENSKGPLILLILFVLLPIALVIEAVKQIVQAVKNLFNKIFK